VTLRPRPDSPPAPCAFNSASGAFTVTSGGRGQCLRLNRRRPGPGMAGHWQRPVPRPGCPKMAQLMAFVMTRSSLNHWHDHRSVEFAVTFKSSPSSDSNPAAAADSLSRSSVCLCLCLCLCLCPCHGLSALSEADCSPRPVQGRRHESRLACAERTDDSGARRVVSPSRRRVRVEARGWHGMISGYCADAPTKTILNELK
jgi:hypothetical protein